jgi:putative ATPase
MKDLGYGADYGYAHDYDQNFVKQEFLPDTIVNTAFYEPGNNPREDAIRAFLKTKWEDKYGY